MSTFCRKFQNKKRTRTNCNVCVVTHKCNLIAYKISQYLGLITGYYIK